MGELGRQVELAYKTASGVMGQLAIMITRRKGNLTKLAECANKLEEAAKELRKAIGDNQDG